jgi:uroporphyrinogen decarboxylase
MDHRERFFATINYEQVDRPASWLGLPVPGAISGLKKYFKLKSIDELSGIIDDDIRAIEVPYNFPPANHIACAFNFAKKNRQDLAPDKRSLTVPGFFEDLDDPSDVDLFDWPDPATYLDADMARQLSNRTDDHYIRMGIMWSAHFQDACSAFGMEKALMLMLTNPEMFRAVIDRIVDFYLKANEIFYEACRGKLDAVLIGNDFGSQTGLMLDPELLQAYVFPGTKKLVDQARQYDLKVMHHSCGSIFPLIEDFIEMGVDIIHPIQALAKDMNAMNLKKHFQSRMSFCGGVDAQYLLVNQGPQEVAASVGELMDIFPTGLIISPSHEAILPDISPANIEAMFHTIRSSA